MHPNAHAFAVSRSSRTTITTSRVLLLDDTYVSGSRGQSAAAALRLSGARSVLVVPVGRVLRPERFVTHAAFIAAQPVGQGHRSRCVLTQTGTGRW
jgi:predicted phosphoribosyltransferase